MSRPEIAAPGTRSVLGDSWTPSCSTKGGTNRDGSETFLFVHQPTGIRVSRTNQYHTRIEVSLPRLLFGSNGRLVTEQAEIDAALDKLWPILDEVLGSTDDPTGRAAGLSNQGYPYTFNGIHFAWHLPIPPADLIRILSNAKHPEVNRRKVEYDTSIRFPGVGMVISVYDKLAEMTANRQRSKSWVRVEVQWKNPDKLKRVLGIKPVEHLDFEQLYAAYRDTLLKFDCPAIAAEALSYNKVNVIAWMRAWNIPAPGGGDPVTWATHDNETASRSKQESRRAFRRKVERTAVAMTRFSFRNYLPVEGPPLDVPGCNGNSGDHHEKGGNL